jgi:hypothetical protein
MVYDIEFENMYSFREKVVFSMEGTETNAKSQNYFRINDSEKCLKVGVIYGANASGKTNLIRSLYSFQRLLIEGNYRSENDGIKEYTPFGLHEESINAPSELKIRLFSTPDNTLYVYRLKYNAIEILEETLSKCNDKEEYLFVRIYQKEGLHKLELKDGISEIVLQQNSIRKNQLGLSFLQAVNVPVVSDIAIELQNLQMINSYNQSMTKMLWENAKELLNKHPDYGKKLFNFLIHLDTGIKGYEIPNEQSEFKDLIFLHEQTKNDGKIEFVKFNAFTLESLGTKNLFLLGVKIIEALDKGYTLFVDELDASLHTYITEFIIKMFQSERINKNHAQLILTTHDINLMDEKSLRLDQIWLMQKKSDGSSELYSLADFDGVDENTNLKDWYMAKRFGGLPKIESIENLFRNEEE